MAQPTAVTLTPDEQALFDRVRFTLPQIGRSPESVDSADAAVALTRSLLERKAIPPVRLRWFTDPELNLRTSKSRVQVFRSNGCEGDDVFAHRHFLPYLKYFIFGPNLPQPVIDEFSEYVSAVPFVSGSDMDDLHRIARQSVRRFGLTPADAADEFWKLALECESGDSYARAIRDDVRRMKA